jgi:hypothetical protein
VQRSERQFNQGRADARDKSELIIEGYQEPRVDENGQPYIAVVALSVISKQAQNTRKLEQLREETVKAEEAYDAACEQFGDESPQAGAAGQAFEGEKAGLLKFMANHPELGSVPVTGAKQFMPTKVLENKCFRAPYMLAPVTGTLPKFMHGQQL